MMFRCHDVPKIMLFNKHVVVAAFARRNQVATGQRPMLKGFRRGLRAFEKPLNSQRVTGDWRSSCGVVCDLFFSPFLNPFFFARAILTQASCVHHPALGHSEASRTASLTRASWDLSERLARGKSVRA